MTISRKLLIAVFACVALTNSKPAYGMKRLRDWMDDKVWQKRQRVEQVNEQELAIAPVSQSNFQQLPPDVNKYILSILIALDKFDFTNPAGILELIGHMRIDLRLSTEDTVNFVGAIFAARNISLRNVQDVIDRTALHYAVEGYLAPDFHPNLDSTRIILCLARGDNFFSLIALIDWKGYTAFHYAASSYAYAGGDFVKAFLVAAGDGAHMLLDLRGGDRIAGRTALMMANRRSLPLLLDASGDRACERIFMRDNDGGTVLHHYGGFLCDFKPYLSKAGLRVSMLVFMANNQGQTALHLKAKSGHYQRVKDMLESIGDRSISRDLILTPDFSGKTVQDYILEKLAKDQDHYLELDPAYLDWLSKQAQQLLDDYLEPNVYPCVIQ